MGKIEYNAARGSFPYKGMSTKRQPKSELIRQYTKLHMKYKEYSEKSLEELEEMLPILNAGYKEVCISVMREKFVANLKANQSVENLDGDVK